MIKRDFSNLTANQIEQFEVYHKELVLWNKRINLTRITDYRDVQLKHFADYKDGFGGKYGIQIDRVDKCAVGWDHKEELTKHESQKGKLNPIRCGV